MKKVKYGKSVAPKISFETTPGFKTSIMNQCSNEGRTLKETSHRLYGKWLKGEIDLWENQV